MIIMTISDQNFENIMIFFDKIILDYRSRIGNITTKANNTAVLGHKSLKSKEGQKGV